MPIYEFYCKDCHTIYNFYSARIDTEKTPACPGEACGNPVLERQVSMFSISKGRSESGADGLGDIDEDRLERAMMSLAGEVDNLDEDDPKQAAAVMRKLFDSTGLKLGDSLEEAMSRMEAGEDPDKIEQEMGDVLEDENPFSTKPRRLLDDLRRKYLPPKVDDRLYEL
jgi:putative FmdB family regulatory protein